MMKISIWQQFSSNHSALFDLVGTFETPEKAKKMSEILIPILWEGYLYNEHYGKTENLTPKEIEHDKTKFDQELQENLVLYKNMIFLTNLWIDWIGSPPFKELIKLFGGSAVSNGEIESTYSYLNLYIEAPNEEIAQAIYKLFIEGVLDNYWIPPWKPPSSQLSMFWLGTQCFINKNIVSIMNINFLFWVIYLKQELMALENYFTEQDCTIEYHFWEKNYE
jgi:hypothetical protein